MVTPFASSATLILSDEVARNIIREAAASLTLTPHTPMGVRVQVTASGEATQGDPIMKASSHTNYPLFVAHLLMGMLPSVRHARIRDFHAMISGGRGSDFSIPLDAESEAIIAAFNAAKPKILRPAQIRIALGAVSASVQY